MLLRRCEISAHGVGGEETENHTFVFENVIRHETDGALRRCNKASATAMLSLTML